MSRLLLATTFYLTILLAQTPAISSIDVLGEVNRGVNVTLNVQQNPELIQWMSLERYSIVDPTQSTIYLTDISGQSGIFSYSYTDTTAAPGVPYRYVVNTLDLSFAVVDQDTSDVIQFTAEYTVDSTSFGKTGLYQPQIEWADIDNDGDLDALVAGDNYSSESFDFLLFENADGNGDFTEKSMFDAGITTLDYIRFDLGDVDNDGDIDIAIVGTATDGTEFTDVFLNNGSGSFTRQNLTITQTDKAVKIVDWNGDGQLDLIIGGNIDLSYGSEIWLNTGDPGNLKFTKDVGFFTNDSPRRFFPADINSDGQMELLWSGRLNNEEHIFRLIRVINDSTVETLLDADLDAGLSGYELKDTDWGDVDNDGDLDALLIATDGSYNVNVILRNDADDVVTLINIDGAKGLGQTDGGLNSGGQFWDMDADGDLDIVIHGEWNEGFLPGKRLGFGNFSYYDRYVAYVENTGNGVYNLKDIVMPDGMANSDLAVADFDNDRDLDFLIVGEVKTASGAEKRKDGTVANKFEDFSYVSVFVRNMTSDKNTAPTSVTLNPVEIIGDSAVFSWTASTDAESSDNTIRYDVIVRFLDNNFNESYGVRPEIASDGFRRLRRLGRYGTNTIPVDSLPDGTYFWTVQAVDNSGLGSSLPIEQEFAKGDVPPASPSNLTADNSERYTITLNWDLPSDPDLYAIRIYRSMYSPDSLDAVQIDELVPQVTAYVDSGLTVTFPGDNYYYWVSAVDSAGNESRLSAGVSTTITGQYAIDLTTGVYDFIWAKHDFGDMDNDGDLDLAITGVFDTGEGGESAAMVFQNNGSGNYTFQQTLFPDIYEDSDIRFVDLDGDGNLEIVLSGLKDDFGGQFKTTNLKERRLQKNQFKQQQKAPVLDSAYVLVVYKSSTDEGFAFNEQQRLVGADYASVRLGDIDNDGDNDVIVSGDHNNISQTVIYANQSGVLTPSDTIDLDFNPYDNVNSRVHDMDNDGDLDIVVLGQIEGTQMDLIENDLDSNRYTLISSIATVEGSEQDFEVADMNGDGLLDIIAVDYDPDGDFDGQSISIHHNTGNLNFTEITNLPVGSYDTRLDVADHDHDGDMDILFQGPPDFGLRKQQGKVEELIPPSSFGIYENTGSGFNLNAKELIYPASDGDIQWVDLDGDGALDIVMYGSSEGGEGQIEAKQKSRWTQKTQSWGKAETENETFYISINQTTNTNSPPSAPSNISVNVNPDGTVSFSWDRASDDLYPSNSISYELGIVAFESSTWLKSPGLAWSEPYRNLSTRIGNAGLHTSYTLKDSLPDGYYVAFPMSLDQNGVIMDFQNQTAITWRQDFTAPDTVYGVFADQEDGAISVRWDESESDDVFEYRLILQDSASVRATVNADSTREVLVTGLTNYQNYTFYVQAVDSNGNVSLNGPTVTTFPIDKTPPDTIRDVTVTDFGNHFVSLSWTANADVDFAKYRIWMATAGDTTVVDSITNINTTTYTVTGLVNDQFHEFAISAVDTAGNESDPGTRVVSATPTNFAPIVANAVNDTTVNEDFSTYLVDLSTVFTDEETPTDSLVYAVSTSSNIAAVAFGSLVTIDAQPDSNGVAEIIFSATDKVGKVARDTVMVTITPVNDAPTVATLIQNQAFNEDFGSQFIDLSGTFADVEELGDSLSLSVDTNSVFDIAVSGVGLQLNSRTNLNGNVNVVVTATDVGGLAVTDTFTVMIGSIDDGTLVLNPMGSRVIDEDADDLLIDVSNVFADPDGLYSLSLLEGDTSVIVSSLSENTLTIRTRSDQSGSAQVVITATSLGKVEQFSANDTLTITVNPVNDAPVVSSPVADINVNEDFSTFTIDYQSIFSDVDHTSGELEYSYSIRAGIVSTNEYEGELEILAVPNAFGTDTLFIFADDPDGEGAIDTVIITVNPVNDAPTVVAQPEHITRSEDFESITIDVRQYFTDVDDALESLTYAVSENSTQNAITVGFEGATMQIQAQPNAYGTDTLYITATDAGDLTAQTALLTVTVTPIVESPEGILLTAGDGQISVRWNPPTEPDIANHRIYYSTVNDVATADSMIVSMPDTSTTISGLSNGSTYFFWLVAEDDGGHLSAVASGGQSAPIDATAPDAPTNLTAAPGNQSVTLNWAMEDPGDLKKFYIYRGTAANPTNRTDSVLSAASRSQTVSGLTNGTTYFFRITAVDTNGNESTFSNQASTAPNQLTLNISVFQNQLLPDQLTINVIANLNQTVTPTMTVNTGNGNQSVTLTAVGNSQVHYNGRYTVSSPGAVTVNVSGTAGVFTANASRQFNVTQVNPDEEAIITVAANQAQLNFEKASVQESAWVISEYSDDSKQLKVQLGAALRKSYEVEFAYTADADKDAGKQFVQEWRNGEWVSLETQVFEERQVVIAATDQGGTFRLFYDESFTGSNIVPDQFELMQNYPNPFNPITTIRYQLPQNANVSIIVYNALGQKVKTLVSEFQRAGANLSVQWDGTNDAGRKVASGLYLYRIQAGRFVKTKKMILVK